MANGEQEEERKNGSSKDKLPKIPDFSERMVTPKRENPFILDDFRGISAYQAPK